VADRRGIVRQLIERVALTQRSGTEWLDVAIRWRGGMVSRHEVARRVHRYAQLRDFRALGQRVAALRGEGRTGREIAEVLNREGYRAPRGEAFTKHIVSRLFAKLGLIGVPAGVSGAEDPPGADEWWLGDLAERLGETRNALHRWRREGWVRARQLPGDQGRWILWADRDELVRLGRLRDFLSEHRREPMPKRLVTPNRRAAGDGLAGGKQRVRSTKGGNG
jgi:hypothetical protein